MEKNTGIILKTFIPFKQRLSILDYSLGKIEGSVSLKEPYNTLNNGVFINYYPSKGMHGYKLEGIELMHVPFPLARHDIYFFHHVLELCYYFIPFECAAANIFELLIFLVQYFEKITSSKNKKVFLLRFFACLGMYPEDEFLRTKNFDYLLSDPFDVMLETAIESRMEKIIEQWLLECIMRHPQHGQFKTIFYTHGWTTT